MTAILIMAAIKISTTPTVPVLQVFLIISNRLSKHISYTGLKIARYVMSATIIKKPIAKFLKNLSLYSYSSILLPLMIALAWKNRIKNGNSKNIFR